MILTDVKRVLFNTEMDKMNAVFLRGLSNVGLSYFKPRIELSAMLECLWLIERNSFIEPVRSTKLYPDGGCSLTIILAYGRARAWLECHRLLQMRQCSPHHSMISARFKPGALFTLFGLSPAYIPESGIDAEMVFSASIKRSLVWLLDRIAYTDTASAMVYFEDWLTDLFSHTRTSQIIDQACAMLSDDGHTIATTAANLGVSRRTLERVMSLQTGFNPAHYRLCQQIKNARLLLCEPTVPLSDVALTCGFYDQSHFTHAFRRFVAETPAHYRQRKLSQLYNIKKS